MSLFVEECRREWKRLRVPDPVANEMAADLEADLAEAEADGLSAEQVLGSGAFDPRSFAASWASERGLISPPPPPTTATAGTGNRPARWLRLSPAVAAIGVIAVFAVIATFGAAVTLLSARSRSTETAVPVDFGFQPGPGGPGRVFSLPAGPVAHDFVHALGVVFLLVGLVGLVVAGLYRSGRVGRGRWSAPASTFADDDGGGPDHTEGRCLRRRREWAGPVVRHAVTGQPTVLDNARPTA